MGGESFVLSIVDVAYYHTVISVIAVIIATKGSVLCCGSSFNNSFILDEEAGLKGYDQHKITWNSLGKAESWCRQNKSPIVSFLFSLCSRNSLLQDELGREGLFLWTMDTRASFITTMQETQNLSPEKGQSPANGDQEQFDSGELSFTITGYLHGHSPPADHQ